MWERCAGTAVWSAGETAGATVLRRWGTLGKDGCGEGYWREECWVEEGTAAAEAVCAGSWHFGMVGEDLEADCWAGGELGIGLGRRLLSALLYNGTLTYP